MFRTPRRSSVAVAWAALLVAGAAGAQPAFSPPLDAPTPLAAPVAMALAPGAAAECVTETFVEGANTPPPPPSALTISIDEAPNGVRVRIVERAGLFDVTLLVSDAGEVSLGAPMEGAFGFGAQLLEQAEQLLPEVRVHRRTLAQGDEILSAEDVAELMSAAMGAVAGQDAALDVSGGSRLVGESSLDGRRVIVFDSEVVVGMPAERVTLFLDGVDAYDAATGLRLYSDIRIRIESPPETGAQTLTYAQILVCSLTSG